ncbi:MAG: O-antigen ligase family protein [Blastocatellia bacterium]|nr:O-antigen ligase family protein [Blastocatellia bacterium]
MAADESDLLSNFSPDHATGHFRRSATPLGLGLVLLALGLGALVASAMTLTKTAAILVPLALCGALGLVIWCALKLPLIPILRLALLASFWFRLEINLFPIIKQGHETPVGLVVSLNLLLNLVLLLTFLYARRQGAVPGGVWPPAFTWTAGVLIVFCVLSVLQGAEAQLGLYALWGLMTELLICYVVAAYFRTDMLLRQVVICFAVAILLNSLLGVLQYLGIFMGWELLGAATGDREMKIPGLEISRASGLLDAANSFGWALVSFSPVILAPALLAKKALPRWVRRLCVVAFFCGVIALLLTFSRGSWMAFAITLPLFAILVLCSLPTKERRPMLIRLAGALVLLLVLGLPFLEPLSARIFGDDEGAAETRLPLMEVAAGMIWDRPFFGVGLSSYEAVMRRYDYTADFITEHFPYPVHNLFMHVAAEAGIPALLCLLTMVGIALHCGWQAWRRKEPERLLPRALAGGLIIGMLAYLITALKEPSSFDSGQMRHLFLLCGLLIVTERTKYKQEAVRRTQE